MIAKLSAHLGPGSLFTGDLSLDLLWTDILNVPVLDPSDVTQWNTWFDTSANADSPFTSVKVSGNKVSLFGAQNLTLKDVLFSTGYDKQPSNNIVSVDDSAGCITTLQYANFANCDALTTVNLPGVTQSIGGGGYVFVNCDNLSSVNLPNLQTCSMGLFSSCQSLTSISLPSLVIMGNYVFEYCTSLTSVEIPICTSLGSDTVYNGIFYGISGQNFSLTVPPDLLTCDFGSPDGDIINLQSNNTVTIQVPTSILSFTPSSIYSPGGTVSITGKGFYSINSITFGGVQATTFSVNSFTAIDAYVENASSGNIVIEGTYGSASISGFNYSDPLKLSLDASVTSSVYFPDTIAPRVLVLGDTDHLLIRNSIISKLNTIGYSTPNVSSRELLTTETGADLDTSNWDVVVMYTNGGEYGDVSLSGNLSTFIDGGGHFISGTFLWNIAALGFDYTLTPFEYTGSQPIGGGTLNATILGTNVSTTVNSATKTSAGGWDSEAHSPISYTSSVSVSFRISDINSFLMGGFSYNPFQTPNNSYVDISYGLYIQPNFLEIYENGNQVTVPGSMTNSTSDIWKVDYDGVDVKYYKNSTLIYTSSTPVTQPLYIFFPLLTLGAGVTDIYIDRVNVFTHPIIGNITSIGSVFTNGGVTLQPGATSLATYDTGGDIAIAYNTIGSSKVVGFNAHVSSNDTNLIRMIANSILWVKDKPTSLPSSTWSDLSEFNNDIVLRSGISQGSYSLIFDGTSNAYATSSIFTVDYTDGFTVESWSKFYDFNSRGVFAFNGSDYGNGYKYINLQGMSQNSNSIRWEYNGGESILSQGGLSPNTWYHLVGVYDNSQNLASLYINGTISASASYSMSETYSTAEFKIGLHDNYMNGEISTVKFLDRPYSESEVLDNYNNTRMKFDVFTISSSTFETISPYDQTIILPGNSGFENVIPGSFYGNEGIYFSTNDTSFYDDIWTLNGLTDYQTYIFNVDWSPGSSASNFVYLSLNLISGVVYGRMNSVDDSDPDSLVPNNSSGSALVGTFLFPATFSLYLPIIQKNSNWC